MRVFKFGGASVKDADAVRNIYRILSGLPEKEELVIVVSAMGKTTNALEAIYRKAHQKEDFAPALQACRFYHEDIAQLLFPEAGSPVYADIAQQFQELEQTLATLQPDHWDQQYDQVISRGELLSSLILHHFLQSQGISNFWLDCRTCLRTDSTWREGRVDWTFTESQIQATLPAILQKQIIVTQGFIGGTEDGFTTTLGREGSDYSAAIFAFCLNASSLTIWKDVPGLLNADPKLFKEVTRYEEVAYQEAIEMAYYGASVIHPKTIQPLANKCIPLFVKSFLQPELPGTVIHDCQHARIAPSFILKQNQCLLSFTAKDLGFISEQHLSAIFQAVHEGRLKINMMQNSALSFSVCCDYDEDRVQQIKKKLEDQFIIKYNQPLHLFTIKNYDQESIQRLTQDREILMEQRTRLTFQFVCRPSETLAG
ncbi:aspartate kinase [Rufibacter sp. DG15C]|uniref:aspartate kinase n=1 Tax=Rufibacter sp. DG15C TaxID=1379909 RepID=UPI00078D0E15|nr:aspartate kinase [Rufibacter sp. DG15C]AMM50229.1 aspartate kinase [Rufibacter sp. DG15C]